MRTFIFILFLLIHSVIVSQGDSCQNAIIFPQNPHCFESDTVSGDVVWYSFVASGSVAYINVQNSADTNFSHVHFAELYDGSCSGLNLLRTAVVEDSFIGIMYHGLIPGNTYFIRLTTHVQGCEKCEKEEALYDLCLLDFDPDPCVNRPICDYICNGNFESFTYCPDNYDQLGFAHGWINPTAATPDFFHACNGLNQPGVPNTTLGSQFPNSGDGFANIVLYFNGGNWREYLMTELAAPLSAGCKYLLSMHVSLGERSQFSTDKLGAFFSAQVLNQNTTGPLSLTPQTVNTPGNFLSNTGGPGNDQWTEVTMIYTASGGERFITIGNFLDDAGTSVINNLNPPADIPATYLFIDDVSLTDLSALTPQPVSVCPGNSVTLSASFCANSYQWSSNPPDPSLASQTGQSVSVTPTVQTDYFVTALHPVFAGCTLSASGTVSITEVPAIPVIVPGFNNDCNLNVQSTYTIQNPDPGVTYNWAITNGTPALGLGTSLGITWTSFGGFITVTAINNTTGCESTGQLFIEPCCLPPFSSSCVLNDNNPTGYVYVDNVTNLASSFFPPNTTVTSQVIVVNGTFTIDEDITFDNCHFLIGTNEDIVILPGNTLTLKNRTAMEASCCKIWDGIFISNQSATLVIDGSGAPVFVEDAKTAVASQSGGVYTIDRAVFNNNHIDILVNPFSGQHAGTVVRSVFSTAISPYSGNAFLLPPFAGQKGFIGIKIDEVGGIQIGDPTSVSLQNRFDNLDFGIKSFRSSITVYNNRFQNITAPTGLQREICKKGTAICAEGFKNEIHTVIIGGTTPFERNIFFNNSFGIIAFQNLNVSAQGNSFSLALNTTQAGTGIEVFNCVGRSVNISFNSFGKFRNGIRTSFTASSQVVINQNQLINNGNTDKGTAIYCADMDFFVFPGGSLTISNNIIDKCQTGINTLNAGPVNIFSNTIDFQPNPSQPGTYYGIGAQNTGGTINQNIIRKNGAVTASLQSKLLGISAEISPGIFITNNQLEKMGTGIRCFGAMPFSTIGCNDMLSCYLGIFQEDSDIGQQGAPGQPSDNTWRGIIGPNDVSRLLGPNFIAPDWYYRSNAQPPFTAADFDPNISAVGSFNSLNITSGPYTCSFFNPCPGCERNTLVRIAADSTPYDQISLDSKYSSWQKVWRMLDSDTTLMYQNLPGAPELQNFYFSHSTGSLGKLHRVKKHILNDNIVLAQTENSSVAPSCPHEDYQKIVNDIYIVTIAEGVFEFTALQDSVLNVIALLNPHVFGRAVYDARAMLGLNFDDPAGNNSNRTSEQNDAELTPEISVYPNPAKNSLFVVNDDTGKQINIEMEVFSSSGMLVLEVDLGGKRIAEIDITMLPDGIYYYLLRAGPELTGFGKFAVIR